VPIVVLRQPQPHPYLCRPMKLMLTLTDTSQDTSHKTTPSGSKASGEFENENEDDFRDQEYGPVGPVDDTTESHHLSSLAASGVQNLSLVHHL
jgi:hypothetical protein